MAATIHPTFAELDIAAREPERAAVILDHVDGCVDCQARLARIYDDLESALPSESSIERLLAAVPQAPDGVVGLILATGDGDPRPGEVWRVGRDEAFLVWTRTVFDDGVAEVVPLTLDVEQADNETILIDVAETPLASQLGAMVALRTGIDLDVFTNRIGSLDLDAKVDEVLTAVREGRRASGFPVGPPIEGDADGRISYREALRAFFAELAPGTQTESEHAEPAPERQGSGRPTGGLDGMLEILTERVSGLRLHAVEENAVELTDGSMARAVKKVSYLDTAVLVVTIDGWPPDTGEIAEACARLARRETDVEAVAVTAPGRGWATMLFTSASLRTAIGVPYGMDVGPQAVLPEFDLVDTLAKHFDGVMTAWDVTEPIVVSGGRRDLRQVVSGHAVQAVEEIQRQGRLARQLAKKTTWQDLPAGLADQVARFVDAVVDGRPVDEALSEAGLAEEGR